MKHPNFAIPSDFEKLPFEILQQIFEYLLNPEYCDKYWDEDTCTEEISYHTGILLANRRLYRDAHRVLYYTSGPVVTASIFYRDAHIILRTALIRHRVVRYTSETKGRWLHIVVYPSFLRPDMRSPRRAITIHGWKDVEQFFYFLKLWSMSTSSHTQIYPGLTSTPRKATPATTAKESTTPSTSIPQTTSTATSSDLATK